MSDSTPCRCGVREGMTHETLRQKIADCREYHFICPKADALYRASQAKEAAAERLASLKEAKANA